MPVAEVVALIRKECLSRRLTVSGGEPLDQLPAILKLTEELSDFDLTVYTGYELDKVPPFLRMRIDYLKVGKFENSLKCSTKCFVGSKNQRFLRTFRNPYLVEEFSR